MLAAAGAVLGATLAQIANHFFQQARDKRAYRKRRKDLFDALKEELRFAVREVNAIFTGLPEEVGHNGRIVYDPPVWPAMFRPVILPKLAPTDPVNPRLIVVLNAAYENLVLVSEELRALRRRTAISPAHYERIYSACDRIVEIYAILLRTSDPDKIPHAFSLNDDDKAKALTLAMFVDDEPFLDHPNLDDLPWVTIDEDGNVQEVKSSRRFGE